MDPEVGTEDTRDPAGRGDPTESVAPVHYTSSVHGRRSGSELKTVREWDFGPSNGEENSE